MALDNEKMIIKLFDGNPEIIKMKYNLLLLTLWEIRNKSCEMSYTIESLRELGIKFEQYSMKDRLEFCDGEPFSMTEKEIDDFYINISMISDHYHFIAACLDNLRLMGVQQDCFEKLRRKKYDKFGLPTEPEKDGDPDGKGDFRQGSLF